MQCKFCNQDVEKPCDNTIEVSKRAISGVSRCEAAMKKLGASQENAEDRLPAVDDEKGGIRGRESHPSTNHGPDGRAYGPLVSV